MRIENPYCPKCGGVLAGTVDTVPGLCYLYWDERDPHSFEFAGETEINWDGQESDETDEGTLVECGSCHHYWRTKIEK